MINGHSGLPEGIYTTVDFRAIRAIRTARIRPRQHLRHCLVRYPVWQSSLVALPRRPPPRMRLLRSRRGKLPDGLRTPSGSWTDALGGRRLDTGLKGGFQETPGDHARLVHRLRLSCHTPDAAPGLPGPGYSCCMLLGYPGPVTPAPALPGPGTTLPVTTPLPGPGTTLPVTNPLVRATLPCHQPAGPGYPAQRYPDSR